MPVAQSKLIAFRSTCLAGVLAAAALGCGSASDDGTGGRPTSSASGTGGSGGGSGSCQATGAPDVPDVSGTWAYYERTSFLVVAPGFSDPFHTAVVSVLLVDQKQSGDAVTFDATYCDHHSEDPDLVVHIIVPDAYTASLPAFTRKGTYEKEGGAWRYRLSKHFQVEGAELADAGVDPLPATSDDPHVVDQDGDGKPGMTLRLTGLVDGEIYIVERRWTEADGGPEASDEVRGAIAFESEQVVLASDPASLKDLTQKANSDLTPCASYFRMKRLEAGADCAFVKENVATLFP